MSETSNRILQLLSEKELSYGVLSEMTKIPKSALQRYATGETVKIPIERLEAIANALNTSVEYLTGKTTNPHRRGTIAYRIWGKEWKSDKQVRIPCSLDSNTYSVLCNFSKENNELIEDTIDRILHEYVETLIEEASNEESCRELNGWM